MASAQSIKVARKAQAIYERDLRHKLEASHLNMFVAIEPESGEYFLGRTLSEATQAARSAYPNRITFALRIGHRSTVEIRVLN